MEILLKMIRPKIFFIVLSSVLIMGIFSSAHAGVNEIQKLDFGHWAITSNTSSFNVTVQPNGAYSHSPKLILLSPPQQGVYEITGLPPSTAILSVNVTMIQVMQVGGEYWTMDNFQTFAPANSDTSGNANISIGARANTTGDGGGYQDGVYNGQLQVDINM